MKKIRESLKKLNIINGQQEYFRLLSELWGQPYILGFHSLFVSFLARRRVIAEKIFVRFLRVMEHTSPPNTYINLFVEAPEFFYQILEVLTRSDYMAEVLARNPEFILWLYEGQGTFDLESNFPKSYFYVKDPEYKLAILNKFKKQQYLCIFFNDVNGNWSLPKVVEALSELADFLIKKIFEKKCVELGINPQFSDLCVIGLGKLGGQELNYSSDIDLIFCVADKADAYLYEKLALGIVADLTYRTEEGFLYRVDLRLRPEGEFGPIIRSVSSYLNYYYSYGELWERQALLKKRFICGCKAVYDEFEKGVKGFIFSHFDYIEMLEIDATRRRIYKIIEQRKGEYRGTLCLNVKTGRGGIRDVEFLVQFLQLNYRVEEANTEAAVAKLSKYESLMDINAKALIEAYRFLRFAEHMLQMQRNEQKYSLPEEERRYREFVVGIGMSIGLFTKKLRQTQNFVHKLYNRVIGHYLRHTKKRIPAVVSIFLGEEDPLIAEEVLRQYGFKEIDQSYLILKELIKGKHEHIHPSAERRTLIYKLHQILLYFKRYSLPDWALKNFSYILEGVATRRYGFYREYIEPKSYRHILVRISSFSKYLSSFLGEHPDVLDLLFMSDYSEFKKLSLVKNEIVAALLIRYLLRSLSEKGLSRQMSKIFDLVFKELVEEMVEKPGLHTARLQKSVLVLCGGKYGTYESSPFSDVDIMFVVGGNEFRAALEFLGNLVSRLSAYEQQGPLFSIDMRIRPEGEKGELAIEKNAFQDYLKGRADFWEFLVYARLRYVWGNRNLFRRIKRWIREIFVQRGFDLQRELQQLRHRALSQPKTQATTINIKKAKGGLLDMELLAHLVYLLKENVLSVKTTESMLRKYVSEGLAKNYLFFRKVELAMQLVYGVNTKELDFSRPETTIIQRFLNLKTRDLREYIQGRLLESAAEIEKFIEHLARVHQF